MNSRTPITFKMFAALMRRSPHGLRVRLLGHLPCRFVNREVVTQYRGIRLRLFTGENLGHQIVYTGRYETMQENTFLALVKPGELVYDIGANIGLYSMLAASAGARVIGFEPCRRIRKFYDSNVRLNGFENRISTLAEAVSDRNGTIEYFEAREGNWGVGRVFAFGHAIDQEESYAVPTRTLDEFVAVYGVPSLVKMDIEGAEWLALTGASATLAHPDAPRFLIEFHPGEVRALGGRVEDLIAKMYDYSYHGFIVKRGESAERHSWWLFSKSEVRNDFLEEIPREHIESLLPVS